LFTTRLKGHHHHIWLKHPDKSVMAGHNLNLGHCIQFHNASILSTRPTYINHIIREAFEFQPNNMNREDGFCQSKSWKLLICSLKGHNKTPSQVSLHQFSTGLSHFIRTLDSAPSEHPSILSLFFHSFRPHSCSYH
jgi:hypothetical protein